MASICSPRLYMFILKPYYDSDGKLIKEAKTERLRRFTGAGNTAGSDITQGWDIRAFHLNADRSITLRQVVLSTSTIKSPSIFPVCG